MSNETVSPSSGEPTFGTLDVYFVRHGESENNVLQARLRREKGLEGSQEAFIQHRLHDPDLTDLGKRQVALVAARMKAECPHVSSIWVSYLSRALGTAAAIHEALPHAAVWVMRDINEVGGSYRYDADTKTLVAVPGVSPREVKGLYPRFQIFDHNSDAPPLPLTTGGVGGGTPVSEADEDGGWYMLDGKETHEQARDRAQRLVDRLDSAARQVPVGTTVAVAVVTHGDLFKLVSNILLHTKLSGDSHAHEAINGRQQTCANTGALDTWIQNTSVTLVRLSEASTASTSDEEGEGKLDGGEGAQRVNCPGFQRQGNVAWKLILFADHSHLTAAGAEAVP